MNELPPFYYLSHFQQILEHVSTYYIPCLDETEKAWLEKWSTLSPNAQALLARLAGRKSSFFRRAQLSYDEFPLSQTLEECIAQNYLTGVGRLTTALYRQQWLSCLKKEELSELFYSKIILYGYLPKNKKEFVEILKDYDFDEEEKYKRDFLYFQDKPIIEWIFFLYFGSFHRNKSLFVLRDLGLRKTHQWRKKKFTPRFQNREEAMACWKVKKWQEENKDFLTLGPKEWDESLQLLDQTKFILEHHSFWHEAVLNQANFLEKNKVYTTALKFYTLTTHSPSRERRVKILRRLGRSEEAQNLLGQIQISPHNTEEAYFSASTKNKISPEAIEKVKVKADWGNSSEEAAIEYLRQERGGEAYYCENGLWKSLFGLLYYEFYFHEDHSFIEFHDTFQRVDRKTKTTSFFERHKEKIFEYTESIFSSQDQIFGILKHIHQNYWGIPNGFFSWHEVNLPLLELLIRSFPLKVLREVCLTMARNLEAFSKGFPDLFYHGPGGVALIEVKAPGDQLRPQQEFWIQFFRGHGINAGVLQLEWEGTRPWSVVDVETTGGRPPHHRITEIAILKYQGQELVDRFHSLVNPLRPIPPSITRLTGISQEMVSDAPSFRDIFEDIQKFTEGTTLVGHNIAFDYRFLKEEFRLLGIPFRRDCLCTVALAKKTLRGHSSYSLKNLCTSLSIPLVGHHRAMADATATATLFHQLKNHNTHRSLNFR